MWRILTVVLLSLSGLSAAPEPTYTLGPPPAWVEVTDPPMPVKTPSGQIIDGIHRIRIERQCDPASASTYHHEAHQVIGSTGIQNGSDLRLTFDPTYESVTLHRLRVLRRGAWEDRLDRTPIRVLQREEELDYHLLDGRLMLAIHLEDIRPDDVVEWSWTVTGEHPTMKGRFFDSFSVSGGHPVHDLRLRVIVPDGRPIRYHLHNGADAPTVRRYSGGQTWTWEWGSTTPWHSEPSLPSWFNDRPWIDLSEHRSWADTVAWALPLYRDDSPRSELWKAWLQECRNAPDAEGAVLRALALVQDDIRYLGIEMGAGSHRPNPPAVVLQRRFGDCKDKSLLLISLLRALGHSAWPALVNTHSRHTITSWLPSPYDFNHVIVALEWNGRLLYLDPTRTLQRGPLSQIHVGDYGVALLVREGETGVAHFQPTPESLPRTEITETYRCPSEDDEAVFEVRTVHRGAAAEKARNDLAGSGIEKLQKHYLEYYSRHHPLIRPLDPMRWQDDHASNTVESVERYAIAGLWDTPATGGREAEFYPQSIRDLVKRPGQTVRRGPFSLDHPVDVALETRIHLWDDWQIRAEQQTIEGPGFVHERKSGLEDGQRTAVFFERHRTTRDHVRPDEMAEYLKSVEVVLDGLGHTLTYDAPVQESGPTHAWPAVTIGVALVGAVGWVLALRLFAATIPPPLPSARGPRTLRLGLRLAWMALGLAGLTGLCLDPAWGADRATDVQPVSFVFQVWLAVAAPVLLFGGLRGSRVLVVLWCAWPAATLSGGVAVVAWTGWESIPARPLWMVQALLLGVALVLAVAHLRASRRRIG